jgi:hypothetical protein
MAVMMNDKEELTRCVQTWSRDQSRSCSMATGSCQEVTILRQLLPSCIPTCHSGTNVRGPFFPNSLSNRADPPCPAARIISTEHVARKRRMLKLYSEAVSHGHVDSDGSEYPRTQVESLYSVQPVMISSSITAEM